MHQNNIVKIDFKDVDLFDWDEFTEELNELALEVNPLMFTFDRSCLWVTREKSFKGTVFEVCVLFMFRYNGKIHQFSSDVIRNHNYGFIILDKFSILDRISCNVNSVIRNIIKERKSNAPK